MSHADKIISEGGSFAAAHISVTPAASARVAQILDQQETAVALRIQIQGGGCSGFRYEYTLVGEYAATDLSFQENGAVLVIDPLSASYLSGAQIDFVQNLLGESFQIKNPRVRSSCGCGTSFSF